MLRYSMYRPEINTRNKANQAIQPVINATSHPEVKPLTIDPMNAESIALNALAAGDRIHPFVESEPEKVVVGKSGKLFGKDMILILKSHSCL